MEIKKTPEADLQNKRGLFMQIGLVLSLLAVAGLFSWSKSEVVITQLAGNQTLIEMDMAPITPPEQPKQETPKVAAPTVSDILNIVKDDIKVDTDINDFSIEYDADAVVEIKRIEKEEAIIDDDAPIIKAEKDPTFMGGGPAEFKNWVQKEVKYPKAAEENGVKGRVVAQCVVERDGSIKDITFMVSPDPSFNEEIKRVIAKAPKWAPGEQRGKPVRTIIILQVDFRLNQ